MRTIAIAAIVVGLLTTSCSTQDVTGAAMGVGMVALTPALPVAAVYRSIAGTKHALSYTTVHKLSDSVFVVSNSCGWFTDQSEKPPYLSAWIIDITKEKKDKNGRILLTESNLNRWFFREHDAKTLERLSLERAPEGSDYYTCDMEASVTIYSKSGTHELRLKQ